MGFFKNFWVLEFFWDFFRFFGLFSRLLRLLLNVTKVTTEHRKWPKISTNSVKSFFLAQRAKKASAESQSSPQELEEGPPSGPHLLVSLKRWLSNTQLLCEQSNLNQSQYWAGFMHSNRNQINPFYLGFLLLYHFHEREQTCNKAWIGFNDKHLTDFSEPAQVLWDVH